MKDLRCTLLLFHSPSTFLATSCFALRHSPAKEDFVVRMSRKEGGGRGDNSYDDLYFFSLVGFRSAV